MGDIRIPGTESDISESEYLGRMGVNSFIHGQETVEIKRIQEEKSVELAATVDIAKDILENLGTMTEGEQRDAVAAYKENFQISD